VLLPFANANVIHHFTEDRPSIEENTKRAYGKVYTLILTHQQLLLFDQVQAFFFFAHCIVFKVRLKTTCSF